MHKPLFFILIFCFWFSVGASYPPAYAETHDNNKNIKTKNIKTKNIIAKNIIVKNKIQLPDEEPIDPFTLVQKYVLANGLVVYLTPSDKSNMYEMRLDVNVGTRAEVKKNAGVSHLLEHVLFRNEALGNEETYLQLIVEKGGNANGTTSEYKTSYFASIPSKHSDWLRENLFTMLVNSRSPGNAEFVKREVDTVLREVGDPTPLNKFLDIDLWQYFKIEVVHIPDFWERDFGIKYKEKFTEEEMRLSTLYLEPETLVKHYNDYYYPSNAELFISGRFDAVETLKWIDATWAVWQNRKGLKMPEVETPKLRAEPYKKIELATQEPELEYGTKLFDMDVKSEVVVSSYMKFLSHRLMKELRNRSGATYGVHDSTTIYEKRYGTSIIYFSTKDENMASSEELLFKYIKEEAEAGGFSDAQIDEAKILYLNSWFEYDSDVRALGTFAQNRHDYAKSYGPDVMSPVSAIRSITNEEYRTILKKRFAPEMRYQFKRETALFFKWDFILASVIIFGVAFALFKKFMMQKFIHTQIRWVRKICFFPLKITEISVTLVGVFGVIVYAQLAEYILNKFHFFDKNIFFAVYLPSFLLAFGAAIIMQGTYAFYPRKLMVVGKEIYIKSLTYHSRIIPLNEVKRVWSHHIFIFNLRFWLKVKWRFYFQDVLFFRRALFLELNNGRIYIFSMRNVDMVVRELNSFLISDEFVHDPDSNPMFPLSGKSNKNSKESA
jgi:zinc protease